MLSCTACQLCLSRKRMVSINGITSVRYILIVDNPTKADEARGKIFSGEEFKLLETIIFEVSEILNILPWSFYIIPMLRCRPTDEKNGKTREPKAEEVLACMQNVLHEVSKIKFRQIFLSGKLVERYYKKEFPDAIVLQSIKYITEQGGQYSPWYLSTKRLLLEGIKK